MARCIALLAALVLLAGTATAYAEKPSQEKAASGTMLYQKTTKYIFEDEVVPVELSGPFDGIIDVRDQARFPTLIKVRADFIPELIKSCEDL